jgi:hypothetical protein
VVATGGKWYTSDINTLITLTLNRPLVRLQQQSTQSIPSLTDTAITFGVGSEDIDTHGFHDTSSNTSRIIPNVAGYYQLTGNVWWGNDADLKSYHAAIAKNGSVVARNRVLLSNNASFVTDATSRSHSAFAILSANGTTDYFELMGQQQQIAAASLSTNAGGSFSSVLECIYLRPL